MKRVVTTADGSVFAVTVLSPFELCFYATKRAHLLAMQQAPRNEAHARYINKELATVNKQLSLNRSYKPILIAE